MHAIARIVLDLLDRFARSLATRTDTNRGFVADLRAVPAGDRVDDLHSGSSSTRLAYEAN